MSPIAPPVNQIWVCYNHLPGGQIVATHFEQVVRERKRGDGTERIVMTSRQQLDSFKKSDFVAAYVGGKLVKHEVVEYKGGQDLSGNPRAADVVIAWAISQGLQPVPSAPKPGEPAGPSALEARVSSLEGKMQDIDRKQDDILRFLKEKK